MTFRYRVTVARFVIKALMSAFQKETLRNATLFAPAYSLCWRAYLAMQF